MKTYYVRHAGNLALTDTTLARLRDENLIAIHYPHTKRQSSSKEDTDSLKPSDYDRAAKGAMSTIQELARDGGLVYAEFRDTPSAMIGMVNPESEVKLDKRFRWNSDPQRTAKLKTLKLNKAVLVSRLLIARIPSRPARGAICKWHKAGKFVDGLWAKRSVRQKAPHRETRVSNFVAATEKYLVEQGAFDPKSISEAKERIAVTIVRRRGQPAFRQKVLAAYGGRCAISGCDAEAVLEAAHIIPYMNPGTNHVQNGLLLRADLHTLFDLGMFTINPRTWRIRLSPSLKRTCYAVFDGKQVRLPAKASLRPDKQALARHEKRER